MGVSFEAIIESRCFEETEETPMGTIGSTSSIENQTRRLLIKNLDRQMKQAAVDGAGMNSWEVDRAFNLPGVSLFNLLNPYLKVSVHMTRHRFAWLNKNMVGDQNKKC
jgi:hypothetical protein